MTEEIIKTEIIQKKESEKVEVESTQKVKQAQIKECDVLVYNAKKGTAIISFNGLGYEFSNITKNPGSKVRVKYTGKIGNNLKLEIVK
jgi:hypothetical protein